LLQREEIMPYLLFAATCLFAAISLGAIKTDEVRYEFGGATLAGAVVYDDAKAVKPAGIVVFPEWWGANDYARRRAHMLAELGYVAFVADMYGEGKTTTDPKEAGTLAKGVYGKPEIMVGRAKAAVQALKASNKCDGQQIAAIGYCMGGSVALNLARSGEDLKAVVAFHAGLANQIGKTGPITPKILVMNGADDKMVSPEETAKFEEEMRQDKADWVLVLFGNAMHAYTNPNADKYRDIGTLGYNETADKRSWMIMRGFLQEAVGE
jgi:dienelactone hydrolase